MEGGTYPALAASGNFFVHGGCECHGFWRLELGEKAALTLQRRKISRPAKTLRSDWLTGWHHILQARPALLETADSFSSSLVAVFV